MTYKNAGIKNIREAITRLMDGEVFYIGDSRIYFDANQDDPFRILMSHAENDYESSLRSFPAWQIKTDWRNNVSKENPVLCWVSTIDDSERYIQLVIGYEKKEPPHLPYETETEWWSKATPVKLSEIKQYILEE